MLGERHIFVLYSSFAEEPWAHGSSSSQSALTPSCSPSSHPRPTPALHSLVVFSPRFPCWLLPPVLLWVFPSKLYFLASTHCFPLGINAGLAKDTLILAISLSILPVDFIAYLYPSICLIYSPHPVSLPAKLRIFK